MEKFLAAALVVFLSASAGASLNCEEPGGRPETRICDIQEKGAHKDFLSLDASLNVECRRALESTDDKIKLRTDQRAWIAQRNRCDSEKCFRGLYKKRIHELSEIARSNARFEGRWERCTLWQGENACTSFSLLQQGKRICGEWSFWASGRVYEGQLMAEQRDSDRADWLLTCDAMRPGCARADGGEPDWHSAKSEFLLCNGVLHYRQDGFTEAVRECKKLDEGDGLLRVPANGKAWEEYRKQPWMRNCLNK